MELQIFYAYSPYGETATLGPDGGNSIQFTGRENDGTGLYYYRARYYDPVLGKRFISEDPLGIAGGVNVYEYALSDPISYVDPDGELPSLPQGLVDFSAGLGDALLLGTGSYLRQAAGVDGGIDECSDAYTYGAVSSIAFGGARLAYAGLAKAGSMIASSGAAASAFRQSLKVVFRGGVGRNWRPPNLTGKSDAALRASAGKTNAGLNAYGAGTAAAGGIGLSKCGCP